MADPKPSGERSRLLKLLAQQDEARTKTLEHLAALDGNLRRIDKKDQGAINENMEFIRDGRAIVVDLQQPKPRELKPHEISRRDQARINANLDKIAKGEMVVVDDLAVA